MYSIENDMIFSLGQPALEIKLTKLNNICDMFVIVKKNGL